MKKNISLIIWQKLQPIVDKYKEIIEVIPTKATILRIIDKDEESNFYFEVIRQELSNGNPGYVIELKPTSENDTKESRRWVNSESIGIFANSWVKVVTEYDSIRTIYDDPIEKQYQEEFYNDFKILDEDAETSRFNFSQQIILLDYIERIETYLSSDENEIPIEDRSLLVNEAGKLKHDAGVETKDIFVKKLTQILWVKNP